MERIAIKKKKEEVQELEKKLKKAVSFFIVDFTGLDANEMNSLRKTFLKENYDYFVTHNNILKRASDNLDLKEIDAVLTGPNALSISYDNPIGPAKIIKDYYKENKLLSIKLCYIEGKWFSSEEAYKIADLPSKEVLIGQFLNLLFSPISRFSRVLKNVLSNCVSVFDEIRKVKERESASVEAKKEEVRKKEKGEKTEKEVKEEEKPKEEVKEEEKPKEKVKEEEKERGEVKEERKGKKEVEKEEKPAKEVKEKERPKEEVKEKEKEKGEVKGKKKGKADNKQKGKRKKGKKEGKNSDKKVEEKPRKNKKEN
jgi:large subunit ribosomal protein L10